MGPPKIALVLGLCIAVLHMKKFKEIFIDKLEGPLSDLLEMKSEATASFYMEQSPVQDPFRARARHIGLRVANLLIDEKGELNRAMLDQLIHLFGLGIYVIGPDRVGDCLILDHVKNCLNAISRDPQIWVAIRKFSVPVCHKKAEEIIRETLWPEEMRIVETRHVRKAVLAAWLTFLRQATGSCFATAPAIFIQAYEPLEFFKDFSDLLNIGQLKRIIGGKEYSVPLNISSGKGDLQKVVSGPFFGLVMALEAVGVKRYKNLGPMTVEKYLRAILLEDASLTEEDLRDEEHLARIQMTPLLARQGAVYFQRPSERGQKVAEWKKRFEKACMAFKSMTECALLRSWEYSLASFSDVKIEFARWNLYIGLGLHPDQPKGIGEFLYNQINEVLQECQRQIDRLTREYEQQMTTLQALEVMIKGASSEMRLNQLKAEWMGHSGSLNVLIETRNRLIAKADSLVPFFSWLIQKYDEKLQESFQELFDPALSIEEEAHLHDDSPAGFRLVYKHGRSDASQWTAIHSKEEYVEALRDFFSQAEHELNLPNHIGKELISQLTTVLIQFIRNDRFIDGAMARSKEKGRLSPWHYISGGTLQTLLMVYCNRDRPFTESSIVPHSPEELLEFLAKFEKKGPLLMHSPTHAFLFYPQLLERSVLRKNRSQTWSQPMQEHIAHKLSNKLPEEEKALFLHLFRQKHTAATNLQFRANILDSLNPRIKQKEMIVDATLYENAFLFDAKEAQSILAHLVKKEIKLEGTYFGPFDLYQLAKVHTLEALRRAFVKENLDEKIAEEMRRQGFLPDALLFADTNWSDWFFGFIQHPATGALELWRMNRTATQGFPMNDWKEALSPKNNAAWIVLKNPLEYSMHIDFLSKK